MLIAARKTSNYLVWVCLYSMPLRHYCGSGKYWKQSFLAWLHMHQVCFMAISFVPGNSLSCRMLWWCCCCRRPHSHYLYHYHCYPTHCDLYLNFFIILFFIVIITGIESRDNVFFMNFFPQYLLIMQQTWTNISSCENVSIAWISSTHVLAL